MLGWTLLAVAAGIAALNFYVSFLRGPLHKWWFRREPNHVSGLPGVGTFLLAFALFSNPSRPMWLAAAIVAILDTCGLPWFFVMILWMKLKGQ